jgi:transcriptional regulator GlxA family with amidase domain
MLRDVVAVLGTQVHPFELGVVCEVFGLDRSEDGLPCFDFAVCAARPQPVPTVGGLTVQAGHGLERTRSADLVVIPAWSADSEPLEHEVVEALREAVDRGATVLSVCSGAFLLAAAGMLEGRHATCHWYHAEELMARYPNVTVDPDRLYVEDGPFVTSAGTSAGIDACLHIVRRELGARVANGIARRMVVPPHRDGDQAQYVDTPVPEGNGASDDLAPLLTWIQEHLHHAHTVSALAARVHMSPRTFARRFTAATGTAPHQWITRQRLLLAQRLLEQDSLDVETIARRSGFATAEALRHHFTRHLRTTPTAYRHTFSHKLRSAPSRSLVE